jgi:hypothetical protein
MAAIFAQVQRYGICSSRFRNQRHLYRVGVRRAARLAQRGDVINIDTQFNHGGYKSPVSRALLLNWHHAADLLNIIYRTGTCDKVSPVPVASPALKP